MNNTEQIDRADKRAEEKKLEASSVNEIVTKSPVLGDLQNLGKLAVNVVKDAAQKVLKEVKLSKSRLESQWKSSQLLPQSDIDVAELLLEDDKLMEVNSSLDEPLLKTSVLMKEQMNAPPIDSDDRYNLMLVSEYANDIDNYMYELEEQQPVQVDHLANQLEISHKMRAVLIDWLNEVHLHFQLANETFHLTVAIIDRYLQLEKDIKRTSLQLVGVTALFIATKYEEMFSPAIADYVCITDNTYTAREIRQMELKIFKAIDNNLSRPLSINFLRRYSHAASAESDHHLMSRYFLELATLDYELASCKPSEMAAASLFLALQLLGNQSDANDKLWTPNLMHYSRYSALHLRPIVRRIAKLVHEAPTSKLRAAYNKYKAERFRKIALRSELSGALMDSLLKDAFNKSGLPFDCGDGGDV